MTGINCDNPDIINPSLWWSPFHLANKRAITIANMVYDIIIVLVLLI